MKEQKDYHQNVKKTWAIDITLRRTFDGTEEEANEIANEDWDYYESQLDGCEFVSFPQALEVYEVGNIKIKNKD